MFDDEHVAEIDRLDVAATPPGWIEVHELEIRIEGARLVTVEDDPEVGTAANIDGANGDP